MVWIMKEINQRAKVLFEIFKKQKLDKKVWAEMEISGI